MSGFIERFIDPHVIMHKFTVIGQLSNRSKKILQVRSRRTGKIYALKLYPMDSHPLELDIVAQLSNYESVGCHPHIVCYYFYQPLYYDHKKYMGLMMEYLDGLTIDEIRQRRELTELEIWELLGQMVVALRSLHRRNIVHRNITTSTIMFDTVNRRWVLTGFAEACRLEKCRPMTPSFYASPFPEDLPMSDVWALGMVLYVVAYQGFPFDEVELEETGESRVVFRETVPLGLGDRKLEAVILKMMEMNPEKRMDIDQIYQLINEYYPGHWVEN